MEAIAKINSSKQTGYSKEQLKDARELCVVIQTVPKENRPVFEAVLNAYLDGMQVGAAIASGGMR